MVDDDIEFFKKEKSRIAGLTLTRNRSGRVAKAPKISNDVPQHKEISLSPAVPARGAGTCTLGPGVDLTIGQQGAQLSAIVTGQPQIPIFPESDAKFL